MKWYTRLTAALAIIGLTIILGREARGATHGDMPDKGTFGAVQVINLNSTKVFTGLLGRNAFAVFNNGPNTIWCGFRSSVTTSTGFPVPAATSLSVDLTYSGSGSVDLYCIASTADQSSPADTRWIQVK